MKNNDIFNIDENMLDEGWKDVVAGGALAAGLAFGGGAQAQTAPVDAPAISAPTQQSAVSRYTPGVEYSAPYVITFNGKDYNFAGRDANAPKGGQKITVGAGAVGIRGLKPTDVILSNDGKYYIAPMDETIDFDQIRRDADASLKATIDKQSDARIAAAKQPKPGFFQQVGQKQIGMVKGAVKGAMKGLRGEPLEEVNPHNYDSDEDYYNALKSTPKRRNVSDYPYSQEDDDAHFREIFRKQRLAKQKAEREADHNRLATGTNESMAAPDYAALYESKLMEMGVGSIATALPTPSAGAGTLFGGSYSQKNNPFKKTAKKRTGKMIKR
jgi:hypothetical protein